MKINVKKPLLNYSGQPFKDDAGQPFTLGTAIMTACSVPAPGDGDLSPQAKYTIGKIGASIAAGSDELTVEEMALMKDRCGKVFTSPALVYTIHTAFEATVDAPKAVKK